ncbi:hypothetical protein [Mesorhizobium sp. CA7]|uniref:hypothetical protein n=1 Tax=Mesorhizobium sp. CA7 TaxID=588501 RepID=UPI001CCE300E|nr:hypothetical protein [Mesorhizobium sp. CA7]MBZ9816518.1 hypothetical protein [Mesorhizobium sp. CA7]
MRMSAREPFGEQQLPFRERWEMPPTAVNDNSALQHGDLSIVVPADDGLAKVTAKAERMGIAAAVAIGLFIGPVVFTCLMLSVWNAALDSNGGKHDRDVQDPGNQGGGLARQAEGSQAQHG